MVHLLTSFLKFSISGDCFDFNFLITFLTGHTQPLKHFPTSSCLSFIADMLSSGFLRLLLCLFQLIPGSRYKYSPFKEEDLVSSPYKENGNSISIFPHGKPMMICPTDYSPWIRESTTGVHFFTFKSSIRPYFCPHLFMTCTMQSLRHVDLQNSMDL